MDSYLIAAQVLFIRTGVNTHLYVLGVSGCGSCLLRQVGE